MHRREDGIVLKWEDLRIEDDQVVGTPVINLAHVRGEQTCYEAENGFLNAASVGHIVVLEYSNDPELMLPGQTGPTITKWYNKECSLVDIPGNSNALTRLYDAQENELNLADFGGSLPVMKTTAATTITALQDLLSLQDADEQAVVTAVTDLVHRTQTLTAEHTALLADKQELQQQVYDLNNASRKAEVKGMLDRALEDKKLTVELRNKLAADYAENPEGLRGLLQAMPAYRSISEHLKAGAPNADEAEWQWDDYEQQDPSGRKLKDLRANNPEKYKELFDQKFNH